MELQLLLLAAMAAVVLAAFPFAIEQLRCEIDRQRLCAAARAFGGIVATRFLTESCTRCRGREMRLLDVGSQAHWIRYQCRACGQSRRADAASRGGSANEAELPYRRYQAMRVQFHVRHSHGLRFDIVFLARAAASPARALSRAPAPTRRRRRALRAARVGASRARQQRGWL
jgi:hypothetical protein